MFKLIQSIVITIATVRQIECNLFTNNLNLTFIFLLLICALIALNFYWSIFFYVDLSFIRDSHFNWKYYLTKGEPCVLFFVRISNPLRIKMLTCDLWGEIPCKYTVSKKMANKQSSIQVHFLRVTFSKRLFRLSQ